MIVNNRGRYQQPLVGNSHSLVERFYPLLEATGLSAMSQRQITLTTDFGRQSPYAASMKGVILSLYPQVNLLDLSHDLPPQNLRHAAFYIRSAWPHFPEGTIHLLVVDPGVGTDRSLLMIEWRNQVILAPDNGVCSWLPGFEQAVARAIENPLCRRSSVSPTFHGRDILAPTAAHLAMGLAPEDVGPIVQPQHRLPWPQPVWTDGGVDAEIIFIDDFGNLITALDAAALQGHVPIEAKIGDLAAPWSATYGTAPPGSLVALFSSDGLVEVALVNGSAARQYGLEAGMKIRLRVSP